MSEMIDTSPMQRPGEGFLYITDNLKTLLEGIGDAPVEYTMSKVSDHMARAIIDEEREKGTKISSLVSYRASASRFETKLGTALILDRNRPLMLPGSQLLYGRITDAALGVRWYYITCN